MRRCSAALVKAWCSPEDHSAVCAKSNRSAWVRNAISEKREREADELITAERPAKPQHKVRGLKVCFLPNA